MSNLKLKGKIKLDDMEFHHIEGGFGEGKKAMLVKDIASIHGRELREINQAINMNKARFKEGLDIIDIKNLKNSINLIDRVFTKQAISNSKNIYLLSERGYSKLLKILEDDFAWEQYEKLVDGYFRMREQIANNQLPSPEPKNNKLELHKKNLDNAVITSNYLIDYIKSAEGYISADMLESFTTVLQAVNMDVIYSLRRINKK